MSHYDEMNPSEYFELINDKIKRSNIEELKEIHEGMKMFISKYNNTGQVRALRKTIFLYESLEKEFELLELGIDRYVLEEDVINYINNISDDVVKITELKNYTRDIPNDIVDVIRKTNHIFDEIIVVFTDYTGEAEREISKDRIEKDPILFGIFCDTETKTTSNKYYFLGDWVDEHCDLTLEKMSLKFKEIGGKDIVQYSIEDESIKEIIEKVKAEQEYSAIAIEENYKQETKFDRLRERIRKWLSGK